MTFVRQLGVNVGKTDANSVLPQRELRLARMMLKGFQGRLGRRKKSKEQERGGGAWHGVAVVVGGRSLCV